MKTCSAVWKFVSPSPPGIFSRRQFNQPFFLHTTFAPYTLYQKTRANILVLKLYTKCWWNWLLQSISATFYKLLFCQIPFAKKISNTNVKYRKGAQNTSVQKKLLVKCWWNCDCSCTYTWRRRQYSHFHSCCILLSLERLHFCFLLLLSNSSVSKFSCVRRTPVYTAVVKLSSDDSRFLSPSGYDQSTYFVSWLFNSI